MNSHGLSSCAAITVSVVSHGHGLQVDRLLHELADLHESRVQRVVVTLNRPEPERVRSWRQHTWPFELQCVERATPLGFGANHNHAFALDGQSPVGGLPLFAVLNPDLHFPDNPFPALSAQLAGDARAGAAYPVQFDACGRLQDSERLVPTPARLLRRHLLRRPHELSPGQPPEWVNAAFLLLRREAYAEVQGFQEDFHMYCEDVDLCLRLQLAGWRLARADDAVVHHEAQRASRRRLRPLFWHVRSLLRLWSSPTWRTWQMVSRKGYGPG